jgi:NAD(P)-dependent dehydrogenase (short-subunit alcohol dehydrogenase family)
MGLVEGKVAFISGVARGLGRSHSVRLAEEGADIIGFDLCSDLPQVEYPLATPEGLEETVRLVEKAGGRMLATVADVRDFDDIASNLQNPLPVPNGLLEPEDVTSQVLHLVSDAGQYITGTTFVVDAGFTAR